MPTRCNRGFYCRSYCLLNMFRAPLCPIIRSSRVLYSGCCLWYFVLWFSSSWSGVELRVMCPVCRMLVNQQFKFTSGKLCLKLNIPGFWDVTSCRVVDLYWHFIGTRCLLSSGLVQRRFPEDGIFHDHRGENPLPELFICLWSLNLSVILFYLLFVSS